MIPATNKSGDACMALPEDVAYIECVSREAFDAIRAARDLHYSKAPCMFFGFSMQILPMTFVGSERRTRWLQFVEFIHRTFPENVMFHCGAQDVIKRGKANV